MRNRNLTDLQLQKLASLKSRAARYVDLLKKTSLEPLQKKYTSLQNQLTDAEGLLIDSKLDLQNFREADHHRGPFYDAMSRNLISNRAKAQKNVDVASKKLEAASAALHDETQKVRMAQGATVAGTAGLGLGLGLAGMRISSNVKNADTPQGIVDKRLTAAGIQSTRIRQLAKKYPEEMLKAGIIDQLELLPVYEESAEKLKQSGYLSNIWNDEQALRILKKDLVESGALQVGDVVDYMTFLKSAQLKKLAYVSPEMQERVNQYRSAGRDLRKAYAEEYKKNRAKLQAEVRAGNYDAEFGKVPKGSKNWHLTKAWAMHRPEQTLKRVTDFGGEGYAAAYKKHYELD